MKTSRIALIAFGLTLAAAPLLAESYSGRILDTPNAIPRVSSMRFDLEIEDYTSDEEVRDLAATLDAEGTRALERKMFDLDRGWLRIGNDVAQEVAVTRSVVTEDGGRILRVVVSRDIGFFETWNQTRSTDYPYTILEIQLDEDGNGVGSMIAAAKIEMDDEGTVEVESLGWTPFRLIGVKARGA